MRRRAGRVGLIYLSLPGTQPASRDQDHPDAQARCGSRAHGCRALRARSTRSRAAQPRQYRPGVRLRHRGRSRLHRDGAYPGQGTQGPLRRQRALRPEDDFPHHGRVARCARIRAPGGDHPPRHQAGERDDRCRRPRQAHRFRRGARRRARGRAGRGDAGRHHRRHPVLHVAGTDPGAGARPAHRHFLGRHPVLRVPDGEKAVRRDAVGIGDENHPGRSGLAVRADADPARDRPRRCARHGQAAREPVPKLYVEQFPHGAFVALAKEKIAALRGGTG